MKLLLRFRGRSLLATLAAVTLALGLVWAQEGTSTGAAPKPPLIAEVQVLGNQAISADAILDQVKAILPPGAELTPQRVEQARRAVMRMGYFDKVTISHEMTDRGARVVIEVVERQRIEKIMFVGNTVLSDEELAQAILTRVGHLVDENVIAKDITRILAAYQRKGYLCNVPSAEVDKFGVLTFIINEMRIEGYEIEGLKRTKKWIVEKQITLKPGQLYRDTVIRDQVAALRRLGLFEEVRVEPRPGKVDPENSIIVVFQCKEKRTGQIALQLGYSSLDDLVVAVGVSESNFRGRAEKLSLSAEMIGRSTYQFSFVEPYLMGTDTSMELSLFDTERRRQFIGGTMVSTASDRFDERRRGGFVRFVKPVAEHTRLSLRFRSEEVSSAFFQGVRSVPPSDVTTAQWYRSFGGRDSGRMSLPPDAPPAGPGDRPGTPVVAAPLHPGGRLTSVTIGLIQDFRDEPADPTRGSYRRVTLESAGSFLGGEEDYRQLIGELRFYHPLSDHEVLAFRLMGGKSFGEVPLFEAFSVGGANTLRGYEEDRFRGEEFVLFNGEYRRKITDSLTAVAFVDVGDAYGGVFRTVVPGFDIGAEDADFDAHVGAGVGLRVKTQVGPLRLDIGFGEDGSRAHFNFGHVF